MTKLYPLQSDNYKLLYQSFKDWLTILNYSKNGLLGLCYGLQEFLHYQERQNKISLTQLIAKDANNFIEHLKIKIGVRKRKNLSNNTINKYIQVLNLFSKYIRETGKSNIGFSLQLLTVEKRKPTWLTKQEIQLIYEQIKDDVLGIRDRAMLAVYYGCGLRLNEGVHLGINDIDTTTKVLHVRKGKHYKERFVPIAEQHMKELKLYMDYARAQLLQENKSNALFIDANRGKPINKQSLYIRIKQLVKKAHIQKKVGTHTLRHSIATHLLQNGMSLERIKDFLGHSHLDSTQIYTHLVNEINIIASK